MVKRQFINGPPGEDPPAGAPKDFIKAEFAKRLQKAITDKGWNQSELARRAAAFTEDGVFGRDNVSTYIRGKTLPGPIHLSALCKVLGVEPSDLVPSRGMPSVDDVNPPLDVKDLGAGRAWLRVNQPVDWTIALKVLEILRGATPEHENVGQHR